MSLLSLFLLLILTTVESLDPFPVIDRSGDTIYLQKGSSVQLRCDVYDKPKKLKVRWQRCTGNCDIYKGVSSNRNVRHYLKYDIFSKFHNTYIISIKNVQQRDEGLYFCSIRVRRDHRVRDSVYIKVIDKPHINQMTTTSDMELDEGDELSLHCDAAGFPSPIVRWEGVSHTLTGAIPHTIAQQDVHIHPVTHSMAGQYMCIASNQYGEDHKTIQIVVKGLPLVTSTPRIVQQKSGYQTKLLCSVDAYPQASRLWWTRGGVDIASDSRFVESTLQAAFGRVHMKLVIVGGVYESDYYPHNEFRCYAENSRGRIFSTVYLEESDEPLPLGGKILAADSAYSNADRPYLCVIILIVTVFVPHAL